MNPPAWGQIEENVADRCYMATRLLRDLLKVEVGRSSKRTGLEGRGRRDTMNTHT